MGRTQKSKEQLLAEIAELRAQLARLEKTQPPSTDAMTDITESKQAEEAKVEIADRFQKLAEATFDVIVIIDKGKVIEANKAYTKLFGYGISEIIGMDALDFVAPESKDLALKNLSSGYERPYELKAKKKDGTIFPVMVCGIKSTYNGRPVRITAIQNLTERKKTEQALHESEEKFRLLVTNLPVAIWSSNVDRTGYYVTPNVEAIYGYTPEEIYQGGENLWFSRIHPDDSNRVKDTYERLFSDGIPVNIEYRIKRKDGQWIWVADKAEIRSNENGSRYYIGIFSDISERKQTEEALREAQWLFSFYVDTIDANVYIKDTQGNYTFINKKTEELFKIKREDLRKRNYTDFDFFDKETAEQLRINDKEVMESSQSIKSEELTYPEEQEKTGLKTGPVHYTTIKFPLKDQQGKVTGVCGFSYDITDRKQAEEAKAEIFDRFQKLAEASFDGIVILDKGEIIETNEAYTKLFGYESSEMIGMNAINFIAPESKDLVLKNISSEYEQPYEFKAKKKDGTIISLLACGVKSTYDGNPVRITAIHDITDRKQSEELLQKSEQQLQQLTENIPGMVYKANADWTAEIITGCKSICGYTANEMNAMPEKWLSLVHPDDKDKIFTKGELTAKPYSVVQTYRILHKDGNIRWVEDHKASRFTEEGKFTGIDGVLFDITERKQVEEALAEANKFRTTLIEALPYPSMLINRDRTVIFANKAAREVGAVVGGQCWRDFGHCEYISDEDKAYFDQHKEKPPGGTHCTYCLADNALDDSKTAIAPEVHAFGKIWEAYWVPVSEDVYLYYALDVTERKEAEKLIRYQRDFENLVTEISTKFINLPADRTDRGIDQALKVLGEFVGVDRAYIFHSSEELSELTNTHEWCADGIKSYINDLQQVSFDSVPWWMNELRKLEVIEVPSVKDLPPEASQEKKIFQAESIKSLIAVPMAYDEHLIGFVGFDSVRTEKTWGEKSITLLRIIAEIFVNTIMRHKTQQELENYHHKMFRAEQLASLGTISATIAHELNQPLTVLQLLLQQSCRALGRKKPDIDKTIENLNDCLGEISKSITTVDRFRKFAIKSSPIDIRKVDLAKTALSIVSVLKRTAKQVKLTMSLDIDKSPLFIRGNIAEFEQIFFVVIQNAIQAADAKKAKKLKINLSSANGQILLEFADTCGGIDPENVDKIFEPFFTTKSREVGTGLGLCILERIVKRYDGSLRFENRPGRGITFYIALPMGS